MSQYDNAWYGRMEESPFGPIWIGTADKGLVAVSLWDDQALFAAEVKRLTGSSPDLDHNKVANVAQQLREYFGGEREAFTVPIDWTVLTAFQELVLRQVYAIPFGRKSTYGEVAKQIGKPKAVRAVGRANATNPIPIIIPCHRVLGSDGKLHGYGAPGGLETKAQLLRLEGSWLI